MGRARLRVGEALRREVRPRRGRDTGTGRPGTRRTSATGAARPRSSASCTTTRSTACGARCRPRGSAGPTPPGSGGQFARDFFEHQLRGTNFATGKIGTPIDFVSFHAKGRPTFVDGHVRMGIAEPARDDRRRLPHHRVVPRAQAEADRHRRIRSRRLRRLPGPAARLPQHHDVFELHGGELRAQARPRRAARREPRGRADLGVRVRGPAVLRRLPRRWPSNGIDLPVFNVFRMFSRMGARARAGDERRRGRSRRDASRPACARSRTSPRWRAATRGKRHRAGLALPRRRRGRARRRR